MQKNQSSWGEIALRSRKSKLLCPTCQTLSAVIDFKPLARIAKLKCGHERGMDITGRRAVCNTAISGAAA